VREKKRKRKMKKKEEEEEKKEQLKKKVCCSGGGEMPPPLRPKPSLCVRLLFDKRWTQEGVKMSGKERERVKVKLQGMVKKGDSGSGGREEMCVGE
jgi:hypothetical protein